MGTVIKFPRKGTFTNNSAPAKAATTAATPASPPVIKRRLSIGAKLKLLAVLFLKGVWTSVWFTLICLWPFLRIIVGIDLVFQGIRTLAYWNTPNVHAGWTFLLHFTAFVALTSLVAVFRPAAFRDVPPMHLPAKKKAS